MPDYMNTREKSALALKLYESMDICDGFTKQEVLAILNTFVEIEVRRHMATVKQPKP